MIKIVGIFFATHDVSRAGWVGFEETSMFCMAI